MFNSAIEDGIQLAYFQGTVRHRVNAFSYVNANGYDEETRENDISILIFRQANVFPAANVITINVNAAHVASGQGLTLASFGFTTPQSTGPSQFAMQGLQTNVVTCIDTLNATQSHFCATDISTPPTIVCFGDNGSGLFAPPPAVQPPATPGPNFLVRNYLYIQYLSRCIVKTILIYYFSTDRSGVANFAWLRDCTRDIIYSIAFV